MNIIAYIIGFAVAIGCIVFPLATHASTHGTVAMIIFGVALLAALILMLIWNKGGTSKFDLDTQQWAVVLGIIAVGFVGAMIAGAVIQG